MLVHLPVINENFGEDFLSQKCLRKKKRNPLLLNQPSYILRLHLKFKVEHVF